MSTEHVGFTQSREAGESMTDKQFYIVQLDATGKIEVAEGATDLIVGVLQNTPAAGEQATYAYTGICKVKAGGTVNIGDLVTTDSSGLRSSYHDQQRYRHWSSHRYSSGSNERPH